MYIYRYIYIYFFFIYIYIYILDRKARQRRTLVPQGLTVGPLGPHRTPPGAQGPPNTYENIWDHKNL